VSNAGDVQPLEAHGDPTSFARQMGVNLLGPQRLLHHLLPPMLERRHGDVVLVTSEVARVPRPHVAGYVSSKAGLEALAETLAMELEGTGVRSAMVRPGPVASEQGTTWASEDVNRIVPSWQRWGLLRDLTLLEPAEVAAAVVHALALPRGARYRVIEVQPTVPPREERP
jgi:NAD(P)-dependent dehydrogenase (short-subunit alcohol dehydrogenase family)